MRPMQAVRYHLRVRGNQIIVVGSYTERGVKIIEGWEEGSAVNAY